LKTEGKLETKNSKPETRNSKLRNAVILAAGLGTRLRPLTNLVPKPLMPVLNRPLLGLLLAQLQEAGCIRVAVNTHHLAEQVQKFLAGPASQGLEVRISHEPELLGTGGGLKQLGEALEGGPFLAVNGDVLTDLDFKAVYRGHRPGAISTLVLHDCPPYNKVWVVGGKVVSIGAPPGAPAGAPLAYTGLQVVSPEMLKYLPPAGQQYDLVAAWREALIAGEEIDALVVSGHFWQDLGDPEAYLTLHRRLLGGGGPGLAKFFPGLADPFLGAGAAVGEGARFLGGVCLGAGVEVGAGASLKNTVVWDGATIAPEVRLEDCIVAAGVRVTESARGRVLA
jgi:mannose-1-phosphate guanylyltransferase